MKRVLITGENGYIGNKVATWLGKNPNEYIVDKISLRGNKWQNEVFSKYDAIIHLAGMVHIVETLKNRELYYKVNRDLTYELAKKAKKEGVNQFIFMSSMSVYGIKNGVIEKDTLLRPNSNYGKSKLQAENLIDELTCDEFKVAIIRAPMIYGEGCKGNYQKLSRFIQKIPVFPNIENKRSMIYINNLCEFLRIIVDNCNCGVFFPQNEEYVSIPKLVKLISELHGKKIKFIKVFNPLIRTIKIGAINKVFGDLFYEKSMSNYVEQYCIKNFEESVILTERGGRDE